MEDVPLTVAPRDVLSGEYGRSASADRIGELLAFLAWVAIVAVCCFCALGCRVTDWPDGGCPRGDVPYGTVRYDEVPAMNLPLEARQRNWGGGSCVHASTVMCMRWQGLDDLAAWWRETYVGGEGASGLASKLQRAGIRYAYTTSGDVAFLEWACRTRRGTGVTFFSNHYICLVHLDQEKAILLDNNAIGKFIELPREEFLRRWRHQYGGWACTVVYSPAPPIPLRNS